MPTIASASLRLALQKMGQCNQNYGTPTCSWAFYPSVVRNCAGVVWCCVVNLCFGVLSCDVLRCIVCVVLHLSLMVMWLQLQLQLQWGGMLLKI